MTGALREIRQARAEGIRPDPVLTVSQWADAHRWLPKKSSAEPGPWRTDRTPYLREILDCLSSRSDVEEVVFMKAAQVGGTEVILNALGYVIDHAPGPAILVQPTVETAKRFSRQRVDPLIRTTPRLREKVSASRARDSGNTVLSKEYPSGQLVITGANSAVGLRSMPAQYAFLDEVDGYPIDVDGEGSPVELVEARQRTFSRRKRIKVSTPTIKGRSAIEEAFDATDRRRYYVACPDCGERQPLEFGQLTWTKLGRPPEAAAYECRACYFVIEEHHKTALLAGGVWVAETPDAGGRVRGYHLNALYAPVGWITWGDIARQFVRVYKEPLKHRVFVNTVLGQTWAAKGEAPEWEALMRRREHYRIGQVPEGGLFVTAGVDVQKDRLVVELVAWGRGKTSWSVDTFIIAGDTDDLERGPYTQLDALMNRTIPHAGGGDMAISTLAIDSGYNAQTIYAWTKRYPLSRVIAVKGQDHGAMLVGAPSPVEVTIRGRKLKRGARVWPVATGMAKLELYGWLKLEAPVDGGDPAGGYCHFPQYGEQFFKELTAEQLVAHTTRKGYQRMEWELIPGRQNHQLDARVYARAAAWLYGLDRYRDSDWAQLEGKLGVSAKRLERAAAKPDSPQDPTTPPSAPAPSSPPPRRRKGERWLDPRSGWLRGRRR
jgi:phage terminase large subunit GpA-like protein